MEKNSAGIERGLVKTASEDGYTVASYERPGIETPPLIPIDGKAYSVGEKVCFFCFNDGTGRILCGI